MRNTPSATISDNAMKKLTAIAILCLAVIGPVPIFYPFGATFQGKGFAPPSYASPAPTLPHVADANARLSIDPATATITGSGMLVSGAGNGNGYYTDRGGTNSGRPYYNLSSRPDDINFYVIQWTGTQWRIYNGSTYLYRSTDDVATPDLVTTWIDHGGGSPLPTVTLFSGNVPGPAYGYQVIQDDTGLGGTIYTFNGDGADSDAGLWVSGAGTTDCNGAYTNSGSGYQEIGGIHTFTSTGSGGAWVINSDPFYENLNITTYPWEGGDGYEQLTGDLPVPIVQRNPIASEANWSHP